MHPYIAQQLGRQKEAELRRQAELARLASANRPIRRTPLPRLLRSLQVRHSRSSTGAPIDVREEPFRSLLADDTPHLEAAASGSIKPDQALC